MLPGRVGDSPILGSGIYVGPAGAVCATGIGEEIMKRCLSKTVYDRIAAGRSPQKAAEFGVGLFPRGISVGLIVVGSRGWGEACDKDMAYFASAAGRTL